MLPEIDVCEHHKRCQQTHAQKLRFAFCTISLILNTFLNSYARRPLLERNVATSAYGRVSTKEQLTENQRLEIINAGYAVDYWFADEGVSGKVMAQQRP